MGLTIEDGWIINTMFTNTTNAPVSGTKAKGEAEKKLASEATKLNSATRSALERLCIPTPLGYYTNREEVIASATKIVEESQAKATKFNREAEKAGSTRRLSFAISKVPIAASSNLQKAIFDTIAQELRNLDALLDQGLISEFSLSKRRGLMRYAADNLSGNASKILIRTEDALLKSWQDLPVVRRIANDKGAVKEGNKLDRAKLWEAIDYFTST